MVGDHNTMPSHRPLNAARTMAPTVFITHIISGHPFTLTESTQQFSHLPAKRTTLIYKTPPWIVKYLK